MMNKLLMGFLIAFIFFVTACSSNSNQSNQTTKAKAPVQITHINHGTISDSVSLSATTFYLNKNKISAPISGYITGVAFQQGDVVRSGQTVFSMETREARTLQSDNLSNLGKVNIQASSGGTVTNVTQGTGDFVQQGAVLAQIASPSNLYLKLFVPFEDQSKISKQHKLIIKLPSGKSVSASYARTLSQADSPSQTLVWLYKPNRQQMLPKGLTLSVNVATTSHNNTQLLPKEAVLSNTTLDSFWVMKVLHDTLVVKVPVKKGIETDRQVEILNPHFTPNDKIIISGQYGLQDSASVQINQPHSTTQ